LALIVKHFLEVGNEPVLVHGVSMEATSELIVHSALRHCAKCEKDHVRGFVILCALEITEEEVVSDRAGELWRATKATEL